MTDQPLIKAPQGWLAYAAGSHFAAEPATALSAQDDPYIGFLKQLDLGLIEASPIAEGAPFSWEIAEQAAIQKADDGVHWRARYAALEALQNQVIDRQPGEADGSALWTERVAEGRYYLNLAEATQREGKTDIYQRASDYLAKADRAFTGIEGEDFFRALGEVSRGRLRAWCNDVIGATASQASALSVFQKYGNKTREAAAAYEMAIANLDANLPDPAVRLFDLSINAHRALNVDGAALARSLQSQARALLAKARSETGTDDAAQLIENAKSHALEALLLSAPKSPSDQILSLAQASPAAPSNALINRDSFRAGRAARDLGAAALKEAELGINTRASALDRARAWLKIVATEIGHAEVFSENGRQSLRQLISGKDAVRFGVLRAAQLEFEILAQTDPIEAAPLLIETGKRFGNQTYTIECFNAASRCFEAEAQRSSDARLANEAAYWRHRSARLALSIGVRAEHDAPPPETLPSELGDALNQVRGQRDMQITRYDAANEDGIFAEVVLPGRQNVSRLVVLSEKAAKSINLDVLNALSERGDIPQIIDTGRSSNEALFILQEIPIGRRLSESMASELSDEMRLRLSARLCRTLASLIRAHGENGGAIQPLYVTMEDIMIEPGNRSVITSFGPVGGKRAPSLGWSFLYPTADPDSSTLKDGLDARALAKMLIILLGVEKINHRHLSFPSYLRRALGWFTAKTPMERLSFEATNALSKLAKGDLKVSRSYEKSLRKDEQISKRELRGVAELLFLASLLDSAASHN